MKYSVYGNHDIFILTNSRIFGINLIINRNLGYASDYVKSISFEFDDSYLIATV